MDGDPRADSLRARLVFRCILDIRGLAASRESGAGRRLDDPLLSLDNRDAVSRACLVVNVVGPRSDSPETSTTASSSNAPNRSLRTSG